jgi:hypothetical protein
MFELISTAQSQSGPQHSEPNSMIDVKTSVLCLKHGNSSFHNRLLINKDVIIPGIEDILTGQGKSHVN